jgi:hypothetical protein
MQLPKYASSTPSQYLVHFLCKSKCGTGRYGRVSKIPWHSAGPNTDPDLFVTCLVCSGTQRDSYNWAHVNSK